MERDMMERFGDLPQRRNRTWQGKFLRMLAWVTDEDGSLFRPIMPVWLDVRDRARCELRAARPGEAVPSCLLSRLVSFAVEHRGFRPGSIQVSDVSVARQLEAALKRCEIDIQVVQQMPEMDEVEADLAKFHRRGATRVDSLLVAEGMTVDQLQGIARAAAAYYEARPWLHLGEDDLIRIHAPTPPAGMNYAVTLGAERDLYGLALHDLPRDHFRYRNQKPGWQEIAFWQLSFGQVNWIPIEDADLWEDHALPVAGPLGYPRIVKYEGSEVRRPSAEQLVFLEGLLLALAAVTEAQVDRGCWTKTVLRSDGVKAKYSLSIPDLARPVSPSQWMMRGYKPDPRIADQAQMMLELYSKEHLISVVKGVEMVLGGSALGVSFEGIGVKPTTPAETARALSYQAIETFGRRRRLLASQALEQDDACVEAHVILGEMAPTLELQQTHYQQAVAAGTDWVPGSLSRQDELNVWAVTSDRTHLRARMGLAMTLDELGRVDDAIELLQQLLALDPADCQNARYLLLPRLMATNRDVEAARLLKAFAEQSTRWAYAQAILAFRLSGSSDAARRELHDALSRNAHVPRILSATSLPLMSGGCTVGSPEEATICIDELLPVLTVTSGVVQWMVSEHRRFERERTEQETPSRLPNPQGKAGR